MEERSSSFFGLRLKPVLLVGAGLTLVWIVYTLQGILAPFVLAFVLSYVLTPLVDRMEGHGLGRTWSILVIFLIAFSFLVIGLFTLGNKLVNEMVHLTEEFLRKESVEKRIVLFNERGGTPVVIQGKWTWQSSGQPFSLISPKKLLFELQPGESDTLKFQFAPADVKSHSGRMELTRRDAKSRKILTFRGNKSPPDPKSNDYDGFIRAGERTEWDGVTLSSRLADFWRCRTEYHHSDQRQGQRA